MNKIEERDVFMELGKAPIYNFIVGTLWVLSGVVNCIAKSKFVGINYWPLITYGGLGVCFYVVAIILIVKQQRRNKKAKAEIDRDGIS